MNKKDLIANVAEKTNQSVANCTEVVNALFNEIVTAVESGESVSIVGFGTFEKKFRDERTGRNPSNGEPIVVKASYVPKFKAGKAFKDRVSGS